MTTEDDFQNALDACPEDHQTRLVFADWLEERDDPRADGYRALGVLRKTSWCYVRSEWLWYDSRNRDAKRFESKVSNLPGDWFESLKDAKWRRHLNHKDYPSRREAEDAASLAFTELPPERRAELLSGK